MVCQGLAYGRVLVYRDCCVSEYPESLRCGRPEVEAGNEKFWMLMQSEKVQRVLENI